MTLKTYKVTTAPKQGDTKIIIKFAWWPTGVEDKLIWFEKYSENWTYKSITVRTLGGTSISGHMWRLDSTNLFKPTIGLPDFKNPPLPPPPHPHSKNKFV